MLRYLRLLEVQLRASALLSMQYRVEFVGELLISFFWVGWSLVPILVVFGHREAVAGWSYEEALVVLGWFSLVKGILEGAVNPSLTTVVEHIRKGTLDFVLLKPADAQFLVSTARFKPARIADVLGAFAIFAVAFHRLGRTPRLADVAAGAALLLVAALTLYSLWILVVSAAFFVVRVDNLSYLFSSIYDAARWPATVFRGFWRILFTFVVPLALMTTYPALALLGRLNASTALAALAGALVFAGLSRLVWTRSIGHYTSASS
ncbi:MAG TPA: ABC-2 family transporter protein [Anaeromyxobacteraceae bacterium]|nr:ABC-2 family transporter protein [Anaeromyxobacteraceae bacterium]